MLTLLASAASAAGGHAKGAAPASGGLPQINVDDFSPQLIWLGISFLLLYLLISKLVLPRVGTVLQVRADRIAKDLGEAQRLKGETEKAIIGYEKAMTEAKARSQKIAQENRDQLNGEINRERAAVDARVGTMTADAERRIAAAKMSAMGKVSEIAGETARSIVSELIGQNVSADEAAKALASGARS